MKIIIVPIGSDPKVDEIDNSLDAMQDIVGGYIETFPFGEIAGLDDHIYIVCNEEGKINGMDENRAIFDKKGALVDIIYGDFFLVSAPQECEDFKSIPDDLIEKYVNAFTI